MKYLLDGKGPMVDYSTSNAVIGILLMLAVGLAHGEERSNAAQIRSLYAQMDAYFLGGHYEQSIEAAESLRDLISPDAGIFIEVQLKSAMAYEQLGLHKEALAILENIRGVIFESAIAAHIVRWLNLKGNIQVALGLVEKGREDIEQAIRTATNSAENASLPYLYNDYGNAQFISGLFSEAEETYLQAITLVGESNPNLMAKLSINLARLKLEQGGTGEAADFLQQAAVQLENIKNDLAIIGLTLAMSDVARNIRESKESIELFQLSYTWLTIALDKAKSADNRRLLSSLYGSLAELYVESEQFNEANYLLGKALENAQSSNASELIYLWQWQRAKVLVHIGNIAEALVSYEGAVNSLSKVRFQLSKGYFYDATFFEKKIKALYVDYVDLLLLQAGSMPASDQKNKLLKNARSTIENLKTAELEDYFQDRCTIEEEAQQVDLDNVEATAAVLYPVILPDRLELLLSVRGNIFQFTVLVDEDTFIQNAQQFRILIQEAQNYRFLPYSERLSRWLITPLLPQLESNNIDTLVIVPDTELFGLPFSALHDESGYLVEKLAVAVTPGLTLTSPGRLNLSRQKTLVAGMALEVRGYSPLTNAGTEMLTVKQLLSGQILQDQAYTSKNLHDSLTKNEYAIVHLTTHGAFGATPGESFLATYDGELSFDELQNLISMGRFRQQPVELLTLSACETAVGNNKAALGLAGVAVKSGARSALASLWLVDDAATTELMAEFYRELIPESRSKSSALRVSQVKLLKQHNTSHPAYWAPFVLIGNWL